MACRLTFIAALLAALLAAPPVQAQGASEPTGIWQTQAGDARVKISKCGGGICGVIASLRADRSRHRKTAGRQQESESGAA